MTNIASFRANYHSISNQAAYRYRVAAFNGRRTFDGFANGDVKLCAVIACTDSTVASCGKRFNSSAILVNGVQFSRIVVKVQIRGETTRLIVPNTLDTSLLPLNPSEITFNEVENWNATK